MAKLDLLDVGTLANQAAARNNINNNSTDIEAAIENTLSRDGSAPNNMEADLDMDSNDILNTNHIAATSISVAGVPLIPQTFVPGNFLQAGTNAVSRTMQEKARESVSVFDFMTVVQIADVQANTAALNVTAAVQAALDAHTHIYFPPGSYQINSLTVVDNKTLTGAGFSTSIRADQTTNTFNVIGSNVEISGFTFVSRNGVLFPAIGSFRTAGAYIRAFGNRIRIRDCYMGLGFIGIENVGTSNSFEGVDIRDSRPTTGVAFNILGGFDISMDHCLTDNDAAAQPLAGVRIKSVGDMTISDCGFIRSGTDLLCDGNSGADTVASLMVVNTFFDTAVRGVAFTPTSGCNIVRSSFINCWASSMTGAAGFQFDSSGGGTIQGVTLVNPQVFLNVGDGIRITGINTTDIDIIGGQGAANSVALQVGNSVQRWRVSNFVAGPVYGETANAFGAFIGTGCTNYSILNCRFIGNTTAQVSNGSPGEPTARIGGNVGYESPVVAPTLVNSWANLGGSQAAGYWKDEDGKVHLRGLVTGGTIGNSICTLPTGFRPTANETFAVSSNAAFGSVQITSAGVVTPTVGNTAWVSLCGLTFQAA